MEDIELNKLKAESATYENSKWRDMIEREENLYAINGDLRSEFQRDYTRVIYSNAYKRLKHKTQVFFSPTNDHVCTRIEHVNHVESISYLLSKAFGLNQELTKTISIAHDLGHSPFGHKGESILNNLLIQDTGRTFWHEKNGLFYVDNIELLEDREGGKKNLNLTYAVRDGIISHCGEIDENCIRPRNEKIDLNIYQKPNEYKPFTWEGCIVKISDKISYLGRDLEDAIRFNILNKEEISILGKELNFVNNQYDTLNNTNIINYLCGDLLKNSSLEKGLAFSDYGLNLINKLKKFNYQKIYSSERLKTGNKYFELVLSTIYEILKQSYSDKIENILETEQFKQYPEVVKDFETWLSNYCMKDNFIDNTNINIKNNKIFDLNNKQDYYFAIIEYISGMTDNKAIDTYNKIINF